jgi:hypothetical protein
VALLGPHHQYVTIAITRQLTSASLKRIGSSLSTAESSRHQGLMDDGCISLAHGQKEIDMLVEDFRDFAKAIRS